MVIRTLSQNLKGLDDRDYDILREMCHRSKNLYNDTLYEIRQFFFEEGKYLNYNDAYPKVKQCESYRVLPSKVAQQTMRKVDSNFKTFFKVVKKQKKGEYDKEISPPNYLDKDGFFPIMFPFQAFQVREDHIKIGVPKTFREECGFEKKEILIPFGYDEINKDIIDIRQLSIVPKADAEYFEYKLTYEKEKMEVDTNEDTWLGIDLGVDNLAACVDSSGNTFILDGRELKSYNRWHNKEVAKLQKVKDKQDISGDTKKITKLRKDRKNYVNDYLNKASKSVVDYCKENKVNKVFVGYNKGWKNEVNMGDVNNQNFVDIPHSKFVEKLTYKLEECSIDINLVNEAHTSKCSFFDDEPVKHHEEYIGSRVERGLFKTGDGSLINSDINGALNIVRKGMPETNLGVGSSGVVDTPKRIRKPFSNFS